MNTAQQIEFLSTVRQGMENMGLEVKTNVPKMYVHGHKPEVGNVYIHANGLMERVRIDRTSHSHPIEVQFSTVDEALALAKEWFD